MFTRIINFAILGIIVAMTLAAVGQTPEAGVKPSVFTGDVVTLSTSEIMLNTANGRLTVLVNEKTAFKRVPPEKPTLSAAVDAAFSEIGVGDKLLVTGFPSADKKSVPARAVYLMTKSDIAQKNAKEAERWATRGISGRVASVNQDTRQITIEVRGLMGSTSVVLTPKENAMFRRYAPDSVKYSEATASSISDVKTGDMLRALGDKSADGLSFAAEEVVTGSFQTVAGTVKSVNVAGNEVLVSSLQDGKEITIVVGPASTLKRFPEEMATRMAGFAAAAAGGMRPGGAAPGGQGQRTGGQPSGQPGGQPGGAPGQGGPGRGFGGTRGGIDDMFDRFPAISAADLKVGDIIAVSSSKNGHLDRITAIKLLAGVEPFIRAAQMSADGPRGGRGSQTGSFTIPGLDGFDFP
jgi:hypothetical protein